MEPLVSICCLAYNHEPYIKQCLEGFLIQKANFPFEILIHDDASTDNTQDIIREYELKYPEIIKPIYQHENQYSKGVGVTRVFQFPRARGKYIALCEGDDYWTDPNKLQKQVDFLEVNPDYSICAHRVEIVYEGIAEIKRNSLSRKHPKVIDLEYAILNHCIPTPSILFRSQIIANLDKESRWLGGDIPLYLTCLYFGKGYIFDEKMCVKRRNRFSITQTNNKRIKRFDIDRAQLGMYENLNEQFEYKYHKQFRIKIAYYSLSLCINSFSQYKINETWKYFLKSIKHDRLMILKRVLNRFWYVFNKKDALIKY